MSSNDPFAGHPAPHRDSERFDAVVDSIGPDSLLVVIGRWMSADLRSRHAPEDVLQETLMLAWRDGEGHAWSGPSAYRSWVLSIAKNRIHDLVDAAGAQKRGGGTSTQKASDLLGSSDGRFSAILPGTTTTPSRVASRFERAKLMKQALDELDAECEPVVRGHLFEQRPMLEIASELGIAESTAWYRFRKGAKLYADRLRQLEAITEQSR